MRTPLSHNDKFAVRDIHWCCSFDIDAHLDILGRAAAALIDFGFQVKLEKNSWKLVDRNGLVVFAASMTEAGGKLTTGHDPVATVFILSVVDSGYTAFSASFDDGQALKPMLISPEDLVARHPGTGLLFATRLMLALNLIRGIKLSANLKKSTNTKIAHNFCG